jgi:hypothetical protein
MDFIPADTLYEAVTGVERGRVPSSEGFAVSEYPEAELDRLTVARLVAAARRDAPGLRPAGAEPGGAERELREIAGDRTDLLAETAGLLLGYYRGTAEEPRARAAAHYCVAAGADPGLIPRWIEVGRRRAAAARQPARAGPETGQATETGQAYIWPEAV